MRGSQDSKVLRNQNSSLIPFLLFYPFSHFRKIICHIFQYREFICSKFKVQISISVKPLCVKKHSGLVKFPCLQRENNSGLRQFSTFFLFYCHIKTNMNRRKTLFYNIKRTIVCRVYTFKYNNSEYVAYLLKQVRMQLQIEHRFAFLKQCRMNLRKCIRTK